MSTSNKIVLKKANLEDIDKECEFIKKVPFLENGFGNFFYPVLTESNKVIMNYVLNLNYSVESIPIYTYFLWNNDEIVGMYHILERLTEHQKNTDGHVSYTILKEYRNKGYGTKGLALLVEEAKSIIEEDEIYMHTTINNPQSLTVMTNNNAYIIRNDEYGIFTRIKVK